MRWEPTRASSWLSAGCLLAVCGHDGEGDFRIQLGDPRLVGPGHRALVEGPDLVVVEVRGDEGLGSPHVGEHPDRVAPDAVAIEPVGVRTEVVPDGREDQRIRTEPAQQEGDVSGDAAEVGVQAFDVEGDVQDVQLVGKDVVLEAVRKHHDVIEGQ